MTLVPFVPNYSLQHFIKSLLKQHMINVTTLIFIVASNELYFN